MIALRLLGELRWQLRCALTRAPAHGRAVCWDCELHGGSLWMDAGEIFEHVQVHLRAGHKRPVRVRGTYVRRLS